MAIFTNATAVEQNKHGLFRSSRLKSTDVGKIYDLIVRDNDNKEIAVDNGVAVTIGAPTGDGLQTRYSKIAKTTDKVAIVGAPAIVKTAFTKNQGSEYNFFIPAGKVAKAYEVLGDEEEVFGVAEYQFTTVVAATGKVAFGNYVVVDGNGGWTELDATSAPDPKLYGFIGQVRGFEIGDNETIVLIECVQNKNI